MPMFPPNHPERLALAGEVHARPPEPVQPPARASYIAVQIDADDRAREKAHLAGCASATASCRRRPTPRTSAATSAPCG